MTAELKRLAEAATPGPWMWDADPVKNDPLGRSRAQVVARGRTITRGYYTDNQGEADAAYIAAASPDAILALIEERDRLREALKQAYASIGQGGSAHSIYERVQPIIRQALEEAR